MFCTKFLMPVCLGGFALMIGLPPAATAATVQPCLTNASSGGANSITFLPINGGGQTYCQSAFGWSDTWFATSQPATYNQHLDVLSGDNAPDLTIGGRSGNNGNQYNLISPWVDGGLLNSQFIGSNWRVINDLAVNGNVGTSLITLGGLNLAITTTVGVNGITEQFTFTNTTGVALGNLYFSDYYNFHSNGSLGSDINCPTTTFNAATGTTTTTGANGGGCSAIVSNGTMSGSQLPLTWDLDLSTNVLAAMATAVTNGNFNNFNNSTGPVVGDGAVDVMWDLGPLAAGASTTFTIAKNFVPQVPEPGSMALFGSALIGFGLFRRRRNAD